MKQTESEPADFLDLAVLAERIRKDYPELVLKNGAQFKFRPPKTIIIGPSEPHSSLLLLHELGHALLGHADFDTDILRLKMERAAWEKAHELARRYGVEFDEEVAEQELDSYREWLDTKSRCPNCRLTRYQTPDGVYHCPRCENYSL